MSLRHLACLALVTLALVNAPLAHAVPTSEATTVKPGKAIDLTQVKPLFKQRNRVAIAGYQVAFVTHNKATAHAMNILGSGTAKASIETFLGNVDAALMKQIADEAYVTFVQKLQEAGLEVVPWETVKTAKAYAQLERHPKQTGYTVNFQGADYALVAAGDFPLWFNSFDGLSGGKGSKKNIKVMWELEKELNAVILQPSLAVDFAYLDTSGGKFSKKASVEAQNGMLIVPAASVFWGSLGGGLSYTKFTDGFWAEGATGNWTKAGDSNNAALVKGLAGLGIDIGPASSKKAIVLDANPAVFKAKTLELLAGAGEVFKRGIQEVRR
ncbi:hypothetical protein [Oleiharenicola lentus]|uniref:hypothetical protein n=1 Tax=Oleiharenicola lentus TaxID=2508720 RepID=UPI003F66873D